MPKGKLTDVEMMTIRQRFSEGWTVAVIAEVLAVDRILVHRALCRLGVWDRMFLRDEGDLPPAVASARRIIMARPLDSVPDDGLFTALWMLDMPGNLMARHCACSAADTTKVAKRLGLPPRSDVGRKARAVEVAAVPAADPRPKGMDDLHWQVLKTGGRYGALSALAASSGKPMTRLMQIWHRVRAQDAQVAA